MRKDAAMIKAILGSGMIATFALAALAQTPPSVKINELNTQSSSWAEIVSFDANPVDISGWVFRWSWDTPADGIPEVSVTIPGVPGSGTTFLQPDGILVISESATIPALPAGVTRIVVPTGNPMFTGVPTSACLYTPSGAGVDYVATSNTNAFETPPEIGVILSGAPAAPAVWNGAGLPVLGGVARGVTADASYRHRRVDSESADDWTNNGTGTPGALNPFQTPQATAAASPVAAFTASKTCGTAPLAVTFQNTSTGEAELVLVAWDLTAGTPGVNVAGTHHAAFVYNTTSTVTLQLLDVLGNLVTSPPTTITINPAAALTPWTACGTEDFEAFPALIPNPCGGALVTQPSTGFEYRALAASSRLRVERGDLLPLLPYQFIAASPSAGDRVAILDVNPAAAGTNELVLHVDYLAVNQGNGFKVRYAILENIDEPDPEDVVAFQDGVTLGNAVVAAVSAPYAFGITGAQGIDGYKEVGLGTGGWNDLGVNRAWVFVEHTIDAAFLAANGLVPSNDCRIIWRQRDNIAFEGNDGLMLDLIQVLPTNPVPGPGQAGVAGEALLDINAAENQNCSFVNTPGDLNGPFFSTASLASGIRISVSGELHQPIVIFAGPLSVNLASFTGLGIGQVDVGLPGATPPIPSVVVLADGTQSDFFNSLWNTGATGTATFVVPCPFVPGPLAAFQCAVFNSSTVVKLSNAVDLTIVP
jgi:PKD repeat protein